MFLRKKEPFKMFLSKTTSLKNLVINIWIPVLQQALNKPGGGGGGGQQISSRALSQIPNYRC